MCFYLSIHLFIYLSFRLHLFSVENLRLYFSEKKNISGAKTFPAKSFPPDGTTFSQISLGQKLSKVIAAYSYWNMQFYQSESAYVKFDFSIPRGASIGVYARKDALPTHTQYDIIEVLSGFKTRNKRGSHVSYFC